MQPVLSSSRRTLTRCLVCGFAEVRSDEVVDRGVVFLHECPRCEHRWTSPTPRGAPWQRPALAPAPGRAGREVSSAA